jgi:hypothetical protein
MTRYVPVICPYCGLPFEVPGTGGCSRPNRCHHCRNRCPRDGHERGVPVTYGSCTLFLFVYREFP